MPGIAQPKIKAFAKEYVESGYNGKQAILALKPELSPGSAAVAASRMLNDDNVQGAISQYSASVRERFESTLSKAIAQCDAWLDCDDGAMRLFAMKWIAELTKSFAQSTKQPNQSKHVHISVPKR